VATRGSVSDGVQHVRGAYALGRVESVGCRRQPCVVGGSLRTTVMQWSVDTARLVLSYVQTLARPLVVLLVIVAFRRQLAYFIGELQEGQRAPASPGGVRRKLLLILPLRCRSPPRRSPAASLTRSSAGELSRPSSSALVSQASRWDGRKWPARLQGPSANHSLEDWRS
jgi:hypothetical protein